MIFHDFGMDAASLAGPLETRLAAIGKAGFSQVMISAADVVAHTAGVAGAARAIRDSGLRVTGLETLRDFEGLSGRLHAYKVDVAKSMLEVCGALGARLLLVEASTSTHADAGADAIVRDLKMLAMLAIPMGIRIAFKGVSRSRTVTDFTVAGDLVLRANCPNLGLAVDAFDVLAARIPVEEIEALDPQQIYLVQLSDYMWQQIRSVEEQVTTSTHYRVFPGEGAHSDDLAKFVGTLDAIGYCGDYSFDARNDDYRQMPAQTVVERSRRAAEWLAETVLRRALPVPNVERLRQRAQG
jgi:sugar phosphate isomerase/epimerase